MKPGFLWQSTVEGVQRANFQSCHQRKKELRLANASGKRIFLEPMAPAKDRHEHPNYYGFEAPADASTLGRAMS